MTLADILGTEGASASPGHIASIAARFDNVARDSDHARHLLSSGSPIQWIGLASELFEQHLSQLPQELSKVSLSIGRAAGALWTYSHTLDDILQQARSLSTQLEQTRSDLAVNRRLLSTATDPTQVTHLNQRVANLKWEERTTRNKASTLRTWLSEAAAVCVSQISQAGEAGMQNSWTRTIKEEVAGGLWVAGYVFDHVIKAAEIFAKMVAEPFVQLSAAVPAFLAHPNWSTASPMFRAAASVTGEVAFVATILALTLTGVGAPAAGSLLALAANTGAIVGVAADVAGGASLAAGVMTVVSDGGMIATGKKVTALEVAGDVVGVVVSGAPRIGKALAGKELAKAAERAGKQGAAEIPMGQRMMARRIQARITSEVAGKKLGMVASKKVELAVQSRELRTLGKLDVVRRNASGGHLSLNTPLHLPLTTRVTNYVNLDKMLVSTNFRAFTIADHVIEGAGTAKDVREHIPDFVNQYSQEVTR